jgi:5-methylcytosine-specific restriction endonuclease McrA
VEALLAKIRSRVARYEAQEEALYKKRPIGSKAKATSAFLRSPEWRSMRESILARDGRVCKECGSTERINVDHIKPKSRLPELALEPTNLRPLCWPCNKKKAASVCR